MRHDDICRSRARTGGISSVSTCHVLSVFTRQERSQMKRTISSAILLTLFSSAALADASLSISLQLTDAQAKTTSVNRHGKVTL